MPNSIATLSMYDWPETSGALDRFWGNISKALKQSGIPSPDRLTRTEHPSTLWESPNLLIGQTCGWPYANTLRGKVIPFARLDHGVNGCSPGFYNSVYIARSEYCHILPDSTETLSTIEKIAINGDDSQSGFHVFREITGKSSQEVIPDNKRVITGAHRNSVKAVAEGKADIAAIDSVAFELAKRFEPEAVSKVYVVGYSKPKPGLPLITSVENQANLPKLYAAIENAISNLDAADRNLLLIKGLQPAKDADYNEFL